ncbi:MAG: hypothetical protein B6244_13775 [Candidatus Cloacimonetes bacterium 4572_55]|nr:MAG: hypothetical protein B6244_13775 [Candidatus Cloacimonetes bacterium 4572_55]
MIITRAPGKVIIIGEYAVLEKAPSLVMAVDRFAFVTLEPTEKFSVSAPLINVESAGFHIGKSHNIIFDSDVDHVARVRLKFFISVFETTLRYVRKKQKHLAPFRIQSNTDGFFDSEVSEKLGLGSSAALTAAICAAILTAAGLDIASGKMNIYRLCQEAHHQAQGRVGSGIDIAASVFGGILYHRMNRMPVRVTNWLSRPYQESQKNQKKRLYWLPIWSGKPMSTRRMLHNLNKFRDSSADEYQRRMRELTRLSEKGCSDFNLQRVTHFLSVAEEYHYAMSRLGKSSRTPIISRPHALLAKIVKQSGGVYKPSGAGGGDLGLAFADSEEILFRVEEGVKAEGFHPINLKIDEPGVCLET